MAKNVTKRTPNMKNIRSKALNTTKKKQGLNLQTCKDENGNKIRKSAREIRTEKKVA
jgi:ribosomal protein L28